MELHTGIVLKAGSHELPSEGSCLYEAAIFAAGMEYRQVNGTQDLPPCFCPVIGVFGITLNDFMPDDERQELIRLIPKLPGSKGSPEVEVMRKEFLLQAAWKHAVNPMLREVGLGQYLYRDGCVMEATEALASFMKNTGRRSLWEIVAAGRSKSAGWLIKTCANQADWPRLAQTMEEALAIGAAPTTTGLDTIKTNLAKLEAIQA